MSTLTTELESVVQRSGTNANSLRTEAERASFASNVKKDIAAIVYQLNTVYNPLVSSLSSTVSINALDLGISGNSIFTKVDATASDAAAYWSTVNSRALTIKETVDLLLGEISRLENELQVALEQDAFDESVLEANIQTNVLNIQQLAKDTYGTAYSLDNDGNANLTYTIAQTIDAIGSHFTGYSSTGLSHSSTYPALTLNVALSNVTLDTTIPQSTVTDLTTDLANIRSFVGMDDAADTTPDYSTHGGGALSTVSDGDSLEEAIYKLDQAAAGSVTKTLQDAYDDGAAGTAGAINLDNSKEAIKIYDDTTSALGRHIQLYNNSGAEVVRLGSFGIQSFVNTHWRLGVTGAAPTAVANRGSIYTYNDPITSDVELFYQHSGASGGAQITKDGRTYQTIVGSHIIPASAFTIKTSASDPVRANWEWTNVAFEVISYPNATNSTAYGFAAAPKDDLGRTCTRYRLTAYVILGPESGAYSSGSSYRLELLTPSAGSFKANDNVAGGTWSSTAVTKLGYSAGTMNDLTFVEFPITSLTTPVDDMLAFGIRRDTSPLNNWAHPIGLVKVKVDWYM